jgi:hypothetical protein
MLSIHSSARSTEEDSSNSNAKCTAEKITIAKAKT